MSKSLHLTIATPLGCIYDGQVDQVTATTESGEITVLSNHVPLVTTLKIGQVMVKKEGREIYHAIDGGVMEVRKNNEVVILSNRAESATDIDIERAEKAIQRAEMVMSEKYDSKEKEYIQLEQNIAKQLNRVKLFKKGQRK